MSFPRSITRLTRALAITLLAWGLTAPAFGDDFIRGDANLDGAIDIGDPVTTLAVLFSGGATTCEDALDANDDGAADIADPIYLLGFLFTSGPAPLAPFPTCGADPTADAIDCLINALCPSAPPSEIYVSPNGDDLNSGGPTEPLQTIGAALILAAQSNLNQVVVAEGTYNEDLELDEGIDISGGYDELTWTAQPGVYSIVESSSLGSSATNIVAPTQITALEFRSSTPGSTSAPGTPSIAFTATICGAALNFEDCRFVAGDGLAGQPGLNGAAGQNGAPGAPGGIGNCDNDIGPNGGNGGSSPIGCPGGSGGNGGVGTNGSDTPGQSGGFGLCGGGAGGVGGGANNGTGGNGQSGASGAAGSPGTFAANEFGAITGGGWTAQVSGSGTDGSNGEGGGGGGGGGAEGGFFINPGTGNGGGGGGGGAEGGSGGTGGQGGGASIAFLLIDSGVTLNNCTLESGSGGDGGNGGNGGPGGIGGSGGPGASFCLSDVGRGGNGGPGGDGGAGGNGIGGPGGPSIVVWFQGFSGAPGLMTNNTLIVGTGGAGGNFGVGATNAPDGPAQPTN